MEWAIAELEHPPDTERVDGALVADVPARRKLSRLVREIEGALGDVGAPALDAIRWRVVLLPASALGLDEVRREIAWRGRTVVGETDTELERLSWFQRWRLRQLLLGNYRGRDFP